MGYAIPIVEIEREIYGLLDGIADRVYVNNAPQAVPERQDSYIVISVGGSVTYSGAYKDSHCYVYLYVRNRESGVQDSVKISGLTNAILARFPYSWKEASLISPRVNFGSRSGEYTRTIIRLRMIIKS